MKNFTNTFELRRQNAEYAALIHIMTRISASRQKREVIDSLKEIFLTLFGAETFSYSENLEALPPEFAGAAELLEDERAEYILRESEGKLSSGFCQDKRQAGSSWRKISCSRNI